MSIFREKFKTLKDVFDLSTERALWKLITQGYIEGLEMPLSMGKEAAVFTGITPEGKRVAVKIYRVSTADFRKMYSYLSSDPRIKLKKDRKSVV